MLSNIAQLPKTFIKHTPSIKQTLGNVPGEVVHLTKVSLYTLKEDQAGQGSSLVLTLKDTT